ncbi:MAG: hypothetical protein H6934_07130 [Burkholderiaceae bacterium]|nr:hypothetical protein [Burkholderiaceae bacterium]
MRRTPRPRHSLALCAFTVTLLAAAGCGSDDATTTPTPSQQPPAPQTTAVSTTVVDGPIQNALVCLDKNANDVCDTDEPSGRTNASGNVTIDVPNADVGKYPVIAVVGTDAVDADNGPVTTAFVLRTPADQTATVSPLTTLVQARIDGSGDTSSAAEAYVKAQTGLAGSLFANFSATAATDTDAQRSALVARVVALAMQRQSQALATVVGQTDASGATVTSADVNRQSVSALMSSLPAIGAAVREAVALSDSAQVAALEAAAVDVVDNRSGLTAANAPLLVGAQRVAALGTADGASPDAASGSLRTLAYTDASNWSYRSILATTADGTPDASGNTRSYEQRSRSVGGAIEVWGFSGSPDRANDLHWSGTDWRACPLGTRIVAGPANAAGWRAYDYCNGFAKGLSRAGGVDITGRSQADVLAQIRAFPGDDAGFAFSGWGPADPAVLGADTFPDGSKLLYYSRVDSEFAPAYDARVTNKVYAIDAAVAAGGDARTDPSLACAQILVSTPLDTYRSLATSLESVVAANHGTPCIFNQSTNANGTSLPTQEWWSQSTLNVGTIANALARPDGTGNYYTTTAQVRIGFDATGNGVTWFHCYQRTGDPGARNCFVVGRGEYAIETLGDGRVMRFSNPSALSTRLGYGRVLVEREGAVWYGYQQLPGNSETIRLNLTGANAMLVKLGIPAMTPN